MSNLLHETEQKILDREELARVVEYRQQSGERGVFTNGCFDLLHLGHVRYLQQARTHGDFLILGLNNDAGVRVLKGVGRPLVPEKERAEILAALSCVDYITIFAEPTAGSLVRLLQPAIYVKGGDYANATRDQHHTGRFQAPTVVQEDGGKVGLIAYCPV